MQTNAILIREAKPADIPALLAIYAPYVRETAISFEYEVPSGAEFAARMTQIQSFYPWLAAEHEGHLLGYAYAHAFVGREAYRYSAELTIYLDRQYRKAGIGGLLYRRLEDSLFAMRIRNLYACIGVPDEPDEYLDGNSADFHAHMGYQLVGHFRHCGYKFGRWYNMVWMEKCIGSYTDNPEPPLPFSCVKYTVL